MCKDLFLDRAKLHDDLRLLGKALKQRWEIPEDFRMVIMSRLRDMIESSPDEEMVLKAIVQVRNMESQNQKDEHSKAVAALESLSNRIADMASRARAAIPGDSGPREDSPDSRKGHK